MRRPLPRPWLLPLVPLYWAGLALRRFEVRRLQRPVVSVGSLSAGGAGKTPVVMALAELLGDVDVLTRGYGRAAKAVERVASEDAARYGDEAVLLSRVATVYVGGDRFAAGAMAERDGSLTHLLDDGFQHRQLARAMDVVLLTLEDVRDVLLPAGNLREPLRALKRADVIVVREDEAADLAKWTEGKPVWVIRRRMEVQASAKPLAFCGLARPEDFFAGVGAMDAVRFRDHHAYTERDVDALVDRAKRVGADGFVTTEKDAVKLTTVKRARLEAVGPLAVATLRVEFADPENVRSMIEERIL